MVDCPSTLFTTFQEFWVATIPDSDTTPWSLPGLTVNAGSRRTRHFRLARALGRAHQAWPALYGQIPPHRRRVPAPPTLVHLATNIALSIAPVSVAIDPAGIVLAVASPLATRAVESMSVGSFRPILPSSSAATAIRLSSGASPRREAFTQVLSPLCQPALDRTDRPPQVASRLLVSATFEIAEDHRYSKALGKPLDLFVQDLPEVVDGRGRLVFDPDGGFPSKRRRWAAAFRATRRCGRQLGAAMDRSNPAPRQPVPS